MTCVYDEETKKETLWYSGKLGIHPDHPRRLIEIPFGRLACWVVFWQ